MAVVMGCLLSAAGIYWLGITIVVGAGVLRYCVKGTE
jgi:hypothetical protein